ncbi:flagellar assembly protein FliH [Poseidonocella pacifica]|uniref:Flagellar assembly protein FliH n=1 Tax=Poseidonocella pacifica TaxID=871651 RepID=A0A1I0XWI4_9RHOB|nr:hypothetical protein [Poseidonocella pacifica]SFB05274.1 flagellar assembly protein FliH [Poseidonocella pacifica]
MSSIGHFLPDFSMPGAVPGGTGMSESEVEEIRLQAFENGYNAGWEDASKAKAEEASRSGEELSRNLADLGFTYHEAHKSVMGAMKPLIEQLVQSVLPEILRSTLGERLSAELQDIAAAHGQIDVQLACSSGDATLLEDSLPQDSAIPLRLVTDESLSDGQIELRFDDSERLIDFSSVMGTIEQATAGFFEEQQKEVVNG